MVPLRLRLTGKGNASPSGKSALEGTLSEMTLQSVWILEYLQSKKFLKSLGVREIAYWLRALVALPRVLSSISSTLIVAHNPL